MKEFIKKIIPAYLLDFYHFILAFLGALFYRFPSQKLKVIGVTGTNGKTTTTEMVAKILEEAGYKIALMNSIRFKIGDEEEPNILKMTMPGRFKIQKFLRRAVNSSCQYAVLEVTSEGIKQHRHRFIDFEAAIFTNLTPEHIEAHGSFEKYRQAKGKLFQATKNIHIINLDDKNSKYFLTFLAKEKITFAISKKERGSTAERSEAGDERSSATLPILAEDIEISLSELKFSVNNVKFNLKLLGEFNIYNALAAICVSLSQGIDLETCKSALEKVKGIPGRMEEVIFQPFKVFVDYAFTPNALEKVYSTLANLYKFTFMNIRQPQIRENSRLICVLGACGGGRDKWKRPVLGEIAAKYCDKIIITNEDPYDEDPMEIIEQVAKGARGKAIKILDRRKAIRKSLEIAKPNDIVIITGKGCEPWICLARGEKVPWDDRKIVREEFNLLTKTIETKWPGQ